MTVDFCRMGTSSPVLFTMEPDVLRASSACSDLKGLAAIRTHCFACYFRRVLNELLRNLIHVQPWRALRLVDSITPHDDLYCMAHVRTYDSH